MSSPWFERLAGDDTAPARLVIFPFAGGGSVAFRSWAPLFPAGLDVQFALLPGRERRFREPAHTSVETLLPPLADAMTPLFDRPVTLFGHSMGAAIAYEVARALQTAGRDVRHLVVSGRRAPGQPRRTPRIFHLPDNAFREALRALNGTPPEVLDNPEMMELLMPLLRADFELSDEYAPLPGPALHCPVTALGGSDDREATEADVAAWRDTTTGPVTVRHFPGDHFFVMAHRDTIVDILAQAALPAAA